jgi:MoxR-like ATPase
MDNRFELYSGSGNPLSQREMELPLYTAPDRFDAPEHYLADKGLRDAVNVALALGQPLLVTGEPGTGKTQLAASIAHELDLPSPLAFLAKTTSSARDLFYHYDALEHFHDAHFGHAPPDAEKYISYDALGLAILLSLVPAEADRYLPEPLRGRGPTRSVVLIDEIDKAPRDFPNDILNEVEHLSFTVRETGRSFRADPGYRPILVLTSNSEKNLPDAFLRRCVFYHIPFPDSHRLCQIIQRRLGPDSRFSSEMIDYAVAHFEEIRKLPLAKKPATAECLAWIRVLDQLGADPRNRSQRDTEALALSCCVLAKTREDLAKVQRAFAAPATRATAVP